MNSRIYDVDQEQRTTVAVANAAFLTLETVAAKLRIHVFLVCASVSLDTKPSYVHRSGVFPLS
jgi:hypothetical protein